jgi:hypothetical protein
VFLERFETAGSHRDCPVFNPIADLESRARPPRP